MRATQGAELSSSNHHISYSSSKSSTVMRTNHDDSASKASMTAKNTFTESPTLSTPSYDSIQHHHDDHHHRRHDRDEEAANGTTATTTTTATTAHEYGEYSATMIRAEFRTYHALFPKPDQLLQQQHSVERLRAVIERYNDDGNAHGVTTATTSKPIPMPRFLRTKAEGGIEPHRALCTLLLDDIDRGAKGYEPCGAKVGAWLVRALSLGRLHRQLHIPADFIRDQFDRVAHVVTDHRRGAEPPHVLREAIRSAGSPVPNFLLDPEDAKQFPPHIALLVLLQEGEQESMHLRSYLYRLAWLVFAAVALILRLVLEVIGGAGAIWGGSEVFHLRTQDNVEVWRYISIAVGVFCFLRFVTLNAPQQEDEGDILGPAGPWSLRRPARLRAVCEHPFHYFARAQAPYRKER